MCIRDSLVTVARDWLIHNSKQDYGKEFKAINRNIQGNVHKANAEAILKSPCIDAEAFEDIQKRMKTEHINDDDINSYYKYCLAISWRTTPEDLEKLNKEGIVQLLNKAQIKNRLTYQILNKSVGDVHDSLELLEDYETKMTDRRDKTLSSLSILDNAEEAIAQLVGAEIYRKTKYKKLALAWILIEKLFPDVKSLSGLKQLKFAPSSTVLDKFGDRIKSLVKFLRRDKSKNLQKINDVFGLKHKKGVNVHGWLSNPSQAVKWINDRLRPIFGIKFTHKKGVFTGCNYSTWFRIASDCGTYLDYGKVCHLMLNQDYAYKEGRIEYPPGEREE